MIHARRCGVDQSGIIQENREGKVNPGDGGMGQLDLSAPVLLPAEQLHRWLEPATCRPF